MWNETGLLLWAINVRGLSVENFGGFHNGFRQRGMWMNSERKVLRQRSHLDCETGFGDHLANANSDQSCPEHALGLRIDDELGHSFRAVESHCTARGSPGKFRNLN